MPLASVQTGSSGISSQVYAGDGKEPDRQTDKVRDRELKVQLRLLCQLGYKYTALTIIHHSVLAWIRI